MPIIFIVFKPKIEIKFKNKLKKKMNNLIHCFIAGINRKKIIFELSFFLPFFISEELISKLLKTKQKKKQNP